MRKLATWLYERATILHMMVFERDTYRRLRERGLDPDDYVEVAPPGTLFELDDYEDGPGREGRP